MHYLSRAEEEVLARIIKQEKQIGPGKSESLFIEGYDAQVLQDIVSGLEKKGLVRNTSSLRSAGAMLTQQGRDYFEMKYRSELEREELRKGASNQGNTYNIQTLSASGSNLILGTPINVTQSIDQSMNDIHIMIGEHGGEDKDELYRLIAEAKSIAEQILQKNSLPEKSGFFQRGSKHFNKHSWFYGAIVQLIGQAIIKKL